MSSSGEKRPSRQRSDFVDEGEIARGGQGSIHRIFEPDLARRVAMKRLDETIAGDDAETEYFLEEARITGQLEHPNIPPIHELGIDSEGRAFFTMKLVDGMNLESIVGDPGFSPANEDALFSVLTVLVKVCEAVAFAHSRGVIHRDLKPENIMVGSYGQVYLMDWGIAHLKGAAWTGGRERENQIADRGRTLADGRVVGTLEYMAPEQAQARVEDIDERTDVFALGAILYRVLAGRPPYDSPTALGTLSQAMLAEPVHPQELAPGVVLPMRLCWIALKAMSKNAADRYPSADRLREEIEAFMRGPGRFAMEAFPAGSFVIREGESGDKAFIIVKGKCRVFKTINGKRMTLGELGPANVFGEAALFTQRPRTATVEAVTDLVATVVTRDSLSQEMGKTGWLGPLVGALADRFRDVDERATRLVRDEEQTRVALGVLYYLNAFGRDVAMGRREAPWLPLRRRLAEQFERTEEQIEALVERVDEIRVDHARDVITLHTA